MSFSETTYPWCEVCVWSNGWIGNILQFVQYREKSRFIQSNRILPEIWLNVFFPAQWQEVKGGYLSSSSIVLWIVTINHFTSQKRLKCALKRWKCQSASYYCRRLNQMLSQDLTHINSQWNEPRHTWPKILKQTSATEALSRRIDTNWNGKTEKNAIFLKVQNVESNWHSIWSKRCVSIAISG